MEMEVDLESLSRGCRVRNKENRKRKESLRSEHPLHMSIKHFLTESLYPLIKIEKGAIHDFVSCALPPAQFFCWRQPSGRGRDPAGI